MKWNPDVEKKFNEIVSKMPLFHRRIAESLVKERAELIAQENSRPEVSEAELVQAFFQEVPPAFKEMMKKLLAEMGIEYQKYVRET
jgi:hypothetical protein